MFGLDIDFVMRQAVDKSNGGITPILYLGGVQDTLIWDYVDDIALFEESDTRMAETSESSGLQLETLGCIMSFKETELMLIGKSTSPNPIIPLENEGSINVVEHFKYLGAFSSNV